MEIQPTAPRESGLKKLLLSPAAPRTTRCQPRPLPLHHGEVGQAPEAPWPPKRQPRQQQIAAARPTLPRAPLAAEAQLLGGGLLRLCRAALGGCAPAAALAAAQAPAAALGTAPAGAPAPAPALGARPAPAPAPALAPAPRPAPAAAAGPPAAAAAPAAAAGAGAVIFHDPDVGGVKRVLELGVVQLPGRGGAGGGRGGGVSKGRMHRPQQ